MSEQTTSWNVALVGGGLAGTLLAVHLARAGHRVAIYERREDVRSARLVKGRSINLALSTRGIHALDEVGLADEVLRQAIPMRGRMIHSERGELSFQRYGKNDGEVIHSVSRNGLNKVLLDAASRITGVSLHFQERCVDVDPTSASAEFENVQTHARRRVETDFVVGADGAFSAVRNRLQRLDGFSYSQSYEAYGYKELTIPPAAGGGFRLEPHALHIWPRRAFMMIALPNTDASFTCTLFLPLEGPHGFASLRSESAVIAYFERWFADALPLMPTLTQDFLAAPASTLVTIRCWPWSVGDKVVLIGDACHTVLPFYGQGMNAAFEDVSVLGACLRGSGDDRQRAFERYAGARKPDVDALAHLALENFVEMRDRVASRSFLLKKRLERGLHRLFPAWYIPLYSLVTFTRTPYAKAMARAHAQARAVRLIVLAGAVILLFAGIYIWR
ncbi:MAG TPA: NAD(P)/FAD-dependent oxidoreductase [Burkholderiales bacterium]|nr:NAD(P)/FAD-dependent oxidoreductase [Burkholderiales bacterium]